MSQHSDFRPSAAQSRDPVRRTEFRCRSAARDFTLLDELVVNLHCRIGRQRKSESRRLACFRNDRGIDTDYFSGHVDQRAAAVAGIDGRIGLQEALESVVAARRYVSRPFALMIPCRHSVIEPNGLPIASTQSPTFTESELPSFADGRSRPTSILITARSVSSSLPTTFAVMFGFVVEAHRNLRRFLHDVMVRQNEAGFVHNEAGTQAADLRPAIRLVRTAEEVKEIERIKLRGSWLSLRSLRSLRSAERLHGTASVLMLTTAGVQIRSNLRKRIGKRNRIGDDQRLPTSVRPL